MSLLSDCLNSGLLSTYVGYQVRSESVYGFHENFVTGRAVSFLFVVSGTLCKSMYVIHNEINVFAQCLQIEVTEITQNLYLETK